MNIFARSFIFEPTPRNVRLRRGFSLVEILVAVAVLALLTLMVTKLVEGGNLAISGSRKHLSADAQARDVFSRFDLDVRRMPLRSDVDVLLSESNNALFFVSESAGSYSGSSAGQGTMTLIGYRVNNQAQLERIGKGLSWTDAPFLTYETNAPTTTSEPLSVTTLRGSWASLVGSPPDYDNGVDADYQVLAEGVFRFFYCFQKKDGSYVLKLDAKPPDGKFHDTVAIVLTLAVLDVESRKIVKDTSKLSSALPMPTQSQLDNGILPAQIWEEAVSHSPAYAQAAGIPVPAATQVRVYQRSFFLIQ